MQNWATSTLVFVSDVEAAILLYANELGFTLDMP